jgi:hypothetical protein
MKAVDRERVGLRRVRWAVRATLAVGISASVCANVLHAAHNPISQVIAGWPPVALMLTVELISRVPTHRPILAIVRMVATSVIAGIAAWVSYWHMASVAARFGETGTSAYLLPISVDGLVVVASVCLVEIAGRLRATTVHNGHASTVHNGHTDLVGDPTSGISAAARPVDTAARSASGGVVTVTGEALRAANPRPSAGGAR